MVADSRFTPDVRKASGYFVAAHGLASAQTKVTKRSGPARARSEQAGFIRSAIDVSDAQDVKKFRRRIS
jgi:hypothetical protein